MNQSHRPDSPGKHNRIAARARNINLSLLALIIVLVTVTAVVVIRGANDETSLNLVRSYSAEASEKFHSYISQDLILVRKAAQSEAVTDWFADETDPVKKAAAFSEMMDYIRMLQNTKLYFGILASLDEFFIEDGATPDDLVPFDRLDPIVYDDIWFFKCISPENTNDYLLNIDMDKFTRTWQLWVNHKVVKDGEIKGVFCSGLRIESILHEMFDKYDNRTLWGCVIDKDGLIVMDSAFSELYGVDHIQDVGGGDRSFAYAIGAYLGGIDGHFTRQMEPQVLKLSQGPYHYASIAPITDSDWSIVVFGNNLFLSSLSSILKLLPLPLTLLFALLIYVVVQNSLMNRLIFRPLYRLSDSVSRMESDDVSVFGTERDDEIGALARSADDALHTLLRRQKLTDTLNRTAIMFLSDSEDMFADRMAGGIRLIVDMIGLDRMSVWRNHRMPDALHVGQVYRWDKHSGGTTDPLAGLVDVTYAQLAPRWEELLGRGETINGPVRDMPEADMLRSFNVVSAFVTPIFVNNAFWGFVLFEDRQRERVFEDDYAEVMRSTAFLCANTVIRDDMMRDIRETAARLKAVVSNYPGVICSADKDLRITLFDGLLLPTLIDKDLFHEGQTLEVILEKEEYRQIMERVFMTFTDGEQDWSFNFNERAFRMTTTPIADHDGKGVVAVMGRIDDLTEMIRLQEKLEVALEEAKDASLAKSDFLSSMSHEIRTPMNAIIGMAQIAAKTEDVEKLKYCLSSIEDSSEHLLGLINNILDMSKIEAGKLELENAPLHVEKMLIRVCNLTNEKIEQKNIKFSIVLNAGMRMQYVGDELRLSQVITNLLSNAVKFTPENGKIELAAMEIKEEDSHSLLRFSVRDNGIGMTEEQMGRLFTAFQQADSSTARRYGGTGLGLTISKGIVEKMNGRIWVESQPGEGSTFLFEIEMENAADEQQGGAIIYGNIRPSDVRLLIADPDGEAREYFKTIVASFGVVKIDEADDIREAARLAVSARDSLNPYDIVFVDHSLVDESGIAYVRSDGIRLSGDNVVIMTSFLNWNRIEGPLREVGVHLFISKPLFPSSILDSINEVVGGAAKNLHLRSDSTAEAPDFSAVTLLLAEDVEINREVFFALLEDTKVRIDAAENGRVAVEMFSRNPEKYDMIIMDVQMPEMDGYEATRAIRSLDLERAGTVPIIAMTANVFKEDIDKCIESGMNDHLAKPIEVDAVMEKIARYCLRSQADPSPTDPKGE